MHLQLARNYARVSYIVQFAMAALFVGRDVKFHNEAFGGDFSEPALRMLAAQSAGLGLYSVVAARGTPLTLRNVLAYSLFIAVAWLIVGTTKDVSQTVMPIGFLVGGALALLLDDGETVVDEEHDTATVGAHLTALRVVYSVNVVIGLGMFLAPHHFVQNSGLQWMNEGLASSMGLNTLTYAFMQIAMSHSGREAFKEFSMYNVIAQSGIIVAAASYANSVQELALAVPWSVVMGLLSLKAYLDVDAADKAAASKSQSKKRS